MKIKVNDELILSYAIIGNVDNSIEISNEIVPDSFVEDFKPKKYRYTNGQIILNEGYENNNEIPIEKPIPNITGSDGELRNMFASMQVQLVQANIMVLQLSEQNAKISQETVKLNQEIEKLKGASEDENVIPEV
ncbi:DUF2977 domain-containing protein [Staphylococcus equorum]|uniref:DUF2977 domain-containing protein n=1 Tax=Staphylococcus equorum TaxID=246432 RepID=UPI00255305DB|nr:DUF2977 domain-containing protein [Staphylococcus equorum]MDK9870187.1 DUF2977 domain-containing protein [Staphylococcus equorum]